MYIHIKKTDAKNVKCTLIWQRNATVIDACQIDISTLYKLAN